MSRIAQPDRLSASAALRVIREIAVTSDNIVILPHTKSRMSERHITRRQIEECCQKGTIVDGPFENDRGHWQVTLYRHAADEEIECPVVIEWKSKLLIITVYPKKRKR